MAVQPDRLRRTVPRPMPHPRIKLRSLTGIRNRHDQEYMTPLIEEFNNTNGDNIYIDYQDLCGKLFPRCWIRHSAPIPLRTYFRSQTTKVQHHYGKGVMPWISLHMDDATRARVWGWPFRRGNQFHRGMRFCSLLPYTASAVRLFLQ